MTDAQQAVARELALAAIRRLRDDPDARRAPAGGRGSASDHEVDDGRRRVGRLHPAAVSRNWRRPARIRERRRGAPTRRRTFRVAIVGAGMSGILAGDPLEAGRRAVRRSSRRTRTSEGRGSRTRTRRARRRGERVLQLLVRAEARLAEALLHAAGAARLLPRLRERVRDARAHPLRDGGLVSEFDEARGMWTLRIRTPDGGEETIARERRDQRGRPAEPAEDAGHRGASRTFEGPSFHSARWDHPSTSRGSASP